MRRNTSRTVIQRAESDTPPCCLHTPTTTVHQVSPQKNIWYTAYFNNWIIYLQVTKHLYLQGQSHKSSLNIYECSLTNHLSIFTRAVSQIISPIFTGTVSQNISPIFTGTVSQTSLQNLQGQSHKTSLQYLQGQSHKTSLQ